MEEEIKKLREDLDQAMDMIDELVNQLEVDTFNKRNYTQKQIFFDRIDFRSNKIGFPNLPVNDTDLELGEIYRAGNNLRIKI